MLDLVKQAAPQVAAQAMIQYARYTLEAIHDANSGDADATATAKQFLSLMPTFVSSLTPEDRNQLGEGLQKAYGALRPSTKDGAADLRVGIVNAMAQVAPTGSESILRRIAGDTDDSDREPSPAVRQTALVLLAKAGSQDLRALLVKLSQTETDPALVKTINDLLNPTRDSIVSASDTTTDASPSNPYAGLAGFKAEDWLLNQGFPLLTSKEYEARVKEAGDNSMSRIGRWFSSEQTIEQTGLQAMQAIRDEQQREWDALTQLALNPAGNDKASIEQSLKAQAVMFNILSAGGQPIGTTGDGRIAWRQHVADSSTDPLFNPGTTWQAKAADVLARVSVEGHVGRSRVADYIKAILIDGSVPAKVKLTLLKAWEEHGSPIRQLINNPAGGSSFISMPEYVATLDKAIAVQRAKIESMGINERDTENLAYLEELQLAREECKHFSNA